MSISRKQLGKILLQLAISGGLIYWLLSSRDLQRQLLTALGLADWKWLAGAFLVYGFVEFLGAIRWHLLLRHFGFRLSAWGGARILLIGIFFNTLLPGLIAGDALRATYLSRRFPEQKVDAILVVVTERVFGLIGLITVGMFMIGWRFHWLHQSTAAGALANLTLLVLGFGAAGIAVPILVRRLFSGSPRPGSWLRKTLHGGHLQIGGRTAAIVFATTLAAHLCYAFSYYFSGRAFESSGTTASFLDMLTVTPIVNTFASLPISLSGVGVRESTFVVLLRDLSGVPPAAAVLIGSLGFAIRALWAVLGWLLLVGFRQLDWNEWTDQLFEHHDEAFEESVGAGNPE